MYSLQIGLNDGTVPTERLFEYTDDGIRDRLSSDYAALQELPTLAMPEIGDDRFDQVARIGRVMSVRRDGRVHRFSFVPSPDFAPLPSSTIENLAGELGIEDWEFRRTHWAVKNVDLFEMLLSSQTRLHSASSGDFRASGAVQFPIDTPRDPKLVGVMMPFAPEFDVVYETIESAVVDAGFSCVRADNVWEHDHVMGDILSILWRSRIVIADLTGRNANVFYETGIAHALQRPTVVLTQAAGDVPFDLQSIRYLQYGLSTDSRARLRKQLTQRLVTLGEQSSV